MSNERILVVEDDDNILELVRYNLAREGYAVDTASSGEEGLKLARSNAPSLVVLDLMLPGIDGVEVCRQLTRDPQTENISILMLTAKGEESDEVTGLTLGADDFMQKPFSPRILLARVKALLRRRHGEGKGDVEGTAAASPDASGTGRTSNTDTGSRRATNDSSLYEASGDVGGPLDDDSDTIITPSATGDETPDLVIHPGRFEVLVQGEQVKLTLTEFRVLHFLARRPGWVFSRYQIVNAVKGPDYPVTERSVDVQIVGLRRKLGKDVGRYIETVRGVGYRFKES